MENPKGDLSWYDNEESKQRELIPEKYEMALGFDIVFNKEGEAIIVELNGTRSGLSGIKNVPKRLGRTPEEKLKHTIDEIRAEVDTKQFNEEKYIASFESADFKDETIGYVDTEKVSASLMMSLKIELIGMLQKYPDDLTEEEMVEFKKYARLAREHEDSVHGERLKMFVNAPKAPFLVDFLISDKFFLRALVPEGMRPREFDEMSEKEREDVTAWVVKPQRGERGEQVFVFDNTSEMREQFVDFYKDDGALRVSVQEYVETKPSEEALKEGNDGYAALRYLQDVTVRKGEYEVTYVGGYQRVSTNKNTKDSKELDPRIVNKSRGAESFEMSKAELIKCKVIAKETTDQVVEIATWLQKNLAR